MSCSSRHKQAQALKINKPSVCLESDRHKGSPLYKNVVKVSYYTLERLEDDDGAITAALKFGYSVPPDGATQKVISVVSACFLACRASEKDNVTINGDTQWSKSVVVKSLRPARQAAPPPEPVPVEHSPAYLLRHRSKPVRPAVMHHAHNVISKICLPSSEPLL